MLPAPEERDLHFVLRNCAALMLEQAQQIPYDHQAQIHFVQLLQRLQASIKLNEIGWGEEVGPV